jgi:hypothetical protein
MFENGIRKKLARVTKRTKYADLPWSEEVSKIISINRQPKPPEKPAEQKRKKATISPKENE